MTCDGKTMETSRRELKRIGRQMLGGKVPPDVAYRCGREHLLVAWMGMRFVDAETTL